MIKTSNLTLSEIIRILEARIIENGNRKVKDIRLGHVSVAYQGNLIDRAILQVELEDEDYDCPKCKLKEQQND